MNVTREQEITRYVDRVRQALGDLAPTVRDEILEDLPEHLAEVAAELPGSLVDRLGPPEVYAAELRAAAGAGAPAAARNLDDRISAVVAKVRRRLGALDTRVGPLIGYPRASEFLRLLRPGWWVLRGYLAAMLVTAVFHHDYGILPTFDDSVVAGMLLLAVAVVGSIWLGRRGRALSRWPRLAIYAGNALAVVFAWGMLANFGFSSSHAGYAPVGNPDPYSHVQDVYVYDSQGRLLENAQLFDQDGQPIRLGNPWCADGQHAIRDGVLLRPGYPYCPQSAPYRFNVPSQSPEAAATPAESAMQPSSSAEPTAAPSDSVGPTPTG